MANNILFDICKQRRRQQLFPTPPIRLELQKSPYEIQTNGKIYTKNQIDMRRKAEILKYSSHAMSTQTNSPTKAEKWKQLINKKISGSLLQKNNNSLLCPNDELIPTPTSYCDVPGPVINLINDETIPLYNYSNKNDSYAITNMQNISSWSIATSNNIIFNNNEYNTLASIYMRSEYDKNYYNFSINTPIGIFVTGDVSNNSITGNNVDLYISEVTFAVFFNDAIVNTTDNTRSTMYTSRPIMQYSFTDLSFNIINSNKINSTFSGLLYVGNLRITNIQLPPTIGSVYDFKLKFNIIASSYSNLFKNNVLNSNVYVNLTPDKLKISNNCNITSNYSNQPFVPFSCSI